MIIIFLIFTIVSLFLRIRESDNMQECIPFLSVSILSWISFLLYFYLDKTLYMFATFEVTSFLIVLLLGTKVERFYQLKFIAFFMLSLLYIFDGVFKQDILYLYVLISTLIALVSKFKIDAKITFPFLLFNIFSMMKVRELVESSISIYIYTIAIIVVLILLLRERCRSFSGDSLFLIFLLWTGIFTFTLELHFLLSAIFMLLTVLILNSFRVKKVNELSDYLLYLISIIIMIPVSKISLPLAIMSLGLFSICLFLNKKEHELLIGVSHD